MCAVMGLPRDVLAKGSATDHAAFASVAKIHNRINETLFDMPQDYAPRFATKPSGGIDPRPWCQGFYAAMNLKIKSWKRLLDLDNPNHGLLLPILIYCVDKKGMPVLGKPRPGPETAHFIEHEAYKDMASSPRPPRTPLRHPL
ncbi:YecA family protein [Mesorhizobium sp.]|nr:YecA family protein [Mesorhizobium sp.]